MTFPIAPIRAQYFNRYGTVAPGVIDGVYQPRGATVANWKSPRFRFRFNEWNRSAIMAAADAFVVDDEDFKTLQKEARKALQAVEPREG